MKFDVFYLIFFFEDLTDFVRINTLKIRQFGHIVYQIVKNFE